MKKGTDEDKQYLPDLKWQSGANVNAVRQDGNDVRQCH